MCFLCFQFYFSCLRERERGREREREGERGTEREGEGGRERGREREGERESMRMELGGVGEVERIWEGKHDENILYENLSF